MGERKPERTARTVTAVGGRERDGIISERETTAAGSPACRRRNAANIHTSARGCIDAHTRNVDTRARARTQTNGGGGNGVRTLCMRWRGEWRCDGRRASGKMSAHWSARNMTWKIINMVRGGDYGQRSAAAAAAAVARQCCRFAVQNINGSRARSVIFIPAAMMITIISVVYYYFFSKCLSFRF